MRDLDHYLGLERLMLAFDETGDPMGDRVRDLMDPIWHRLLPEEIALLDARGLIEPSGLFPVKLPGPAPAALPTPTVSGMTFDAGNGWQAPVDWKRAA